MVWIGPVRLSICDPLSKSKLNVRAVLRFYSASLEINTKFVTFYCLNAQIQKFN